MFEAAIGTAIAFILIIVLYFDVKKVAGLGVFVDVGFGALAMWMFAGTYAGMMTGIIAGIFVSLFLFGVRKSVGYKKLEVKRYQGQTVPMPRWTNVPPEFQR
jgi:hypothetical protein